MEMVELKEYLETIRSETTEGFKNQLVSEENLSKEMRETPTKWQRGKKRQGKDGQFEIFSICFFVKCSMFCETECPQNMELHNN